MAKTTRVRRTAQRSRSRTTAATRARGTTARKRADTFGTHPKVGHGFTILDFNTPAEADRGIAKLVAARGTEPAGTHMGSIDRMEDPNAKPTNGRRRPGTRVIVEMFTNAPQPQGSETAHTVLTGLATWVAGVSAGNPGLPNHWCCYQDQP